MHAPAGVPDQTFKAKMQIEAQCVGDADPSCGSGEHTRIIECGCSDELFIYGTAAPADGDGR